MLEENISWKLCGQAGNQTCDAWTWSQLSRNFINGLIVRDNAQLLALHFGFHGNLNLLWVFNGKLLDLEVTEKLHDLFKCIISSFLLLIYLNFWVCVCVCVCVWGGWFTFLSRIFQLYQAGLGSSVGCTLDCWSGGCEFEAPVRQHSFVDIDHEIFSTVIVSLPLIQEGKLSVTCERMCTEYWLTA